MVPPMIHVAVFRDWKELTLVANIREVNLTRKRVDESWHIYLTFWLSECCKLPCFRTFVVHKIVGMSILLTRLLHSAGLWQSRRAIINLSNSEAASFGKRDKPPFPNARYQIHSPRIPLSIPKVVARKLSEKFDLSDWGVWLMYGMMLVRTTSKELDNWMAENGSEKEGSVNTANSSSSRVWWFIFWLTWCV